MRLIARWMAVGIVAAAGVTFAAGSGGRAGAGLGPPAEGAASSAPTFTETAPQEVLAPEQSAAKAKELIQQAIQALGGQAYLGVRDTYCAGRVAQFASQGELSGYERFYDYYLLPDKNRTEFSKKHNIILTFNGDHGWVLDKGGVEVASADSVDDFKEGLMRSHDHLFRFRLNEPGLSFRYTGTAIVDLKRVDLVEVSDRERRTIRVALDVTSRLPLRVVSTVRDRATRQRIEEVEYLSNYHSLQGVQTPFQVSRERNGRMVYQVFFESCQYNTGQKEAFFTREALEQRWAQLSKGKKKK